MKSGRISISKWISALAVALAVQVVVACGKDAPAPAKVQPITNKSGFAALSVADLASPQASWLVGTWTSDAREDGDYRQFIFTNAPRQLTYEWYNAQVGSDRDASLPPSPTYCSYRYLSSDFKLETGGPVSQTPRGVSTNNQPFGQPGLSLNQPFGQRGVSLNQPFGQPPLNNQPSVAQPFGSPVSQVGLYANQTGATEIDVEITAHVSSVELIDEASQDDPGCQQFLAAEQKEAQGNAFTFAFYRDRKGEIYQDGWTLKKN